MGLNQNILQLRCIAQPFRVLVILPGKYIQIVPIILYNWKYFVYSLYILNNIYNNFNICEVLHFIIYV
jgi:hypothetical protein